MEPRRRISQAIALASIVSSVTALATTGQTTGMVSAVRYSNSGTSPVLSFKVFSGSSYYTLQAKTGVSPCAGVAAPPVDTVKAWESLGQAALLSGRNVTVSWIDCGPNTPFWVTDVTLTQFQ